VKLPEASLATIVLAPLAEAAVVALFGILVKEAPDPLNEVAVIAPALNSPDAPRVTMVEAPLADAAVVLALAIVPLEMFDALIAEIEAPPPMKLVAVTALAVKFPDASRATIVLAPLAALAFDATVNVLAPA
jgi:hypothetical protein